MHPSCRRGPVVQAPFLRLPNAAWRSLLVSDFCVENIYVSDGERGGLLRQPSCTGQGGTRVPALR